MPDRHPIDDAPLPDGLHDDEYPAADDDYGDFLEPDQPQEYPDYD